MKNATSPATNEKETATPITVEDAAVVLVHMGKIRADFSKKEHGAYISEDIDGLFTSTDGSPLGDCCATRTGDLSLTGFDEPFGGTAFSLWASRSAKSDDVMKVSERLSDRDDPPSKERIAQALKSIMPAACAEAVAHLVDVAWGFDFDHDDIEEEGFDTLKGVDVLYTLGDNFVTLDAGRKNWAGAWFVEVRSYRHIPVLTVDVHGNLDPENYVEWPDHRDEAETFAFVVRPRR